LVALRFAGWLVGWLVRWLAGDGPSERESWKLYDPCELIRSYNDISRPLHIFVDQGAQDDKLQALASPNLVVAAQANPHGLVTVNLRMQEGYDHDLVFFVGSFVAEHVAYHAEHLRCQ